MASYRDLSSNPVSIFHNTLMKGGPDSLDYRIHRLYLYRGVRLPQLYN